MWQRASRAWSHFPLFRSAAAASQVRGLTALWQVGSVSLPHTLLDVLYGGDYISDKPSQSSLRLPDPAQTNMTQHKWVWHVPIQSLPSSFSFTPLSSRQRHSVEEVCVHVCVRVCGGLRGQTPNAHSTLVIQPLGHLVLHLLLFPRWWKEGLIFCSAEGREKWAFHFSNFNLPSFTVKKILHSSVLASQFANHKPPG